jgi:hypothetical protein
LLDARLRASDACDGPRERQVPRNVPFFRFCDWWSTFGEAYSTGSVSRPAWLKKPAMGLRSRIPGFAFLLPQLQECACARFLRIGEYDRGTPLRAATKRDQRAGQPSLWA